MDKDKKDEIKNNEDVESVVGLFKETITMFQTEIDILKNELQLLKDQPANLTIEDINKKIDAKSNDLLTEMILKVSERAVKTEKEKTKQSIDDILWKRDK